MNLATVSAINALTAVTELLNGGTLRLYDGVQPVSPETALAGTNHNLATFTFSPQAFGSYTLANNNEQQSASFVNASVLPGIAGTVSFARASMATTAWGTSVAYALGAIVTNASNLYICTKPGTSSGTPGGPSTTYGNSGTAAYSIADGTAVWSYLGASTATTVADFSVNTSGADIIIGNNALVTSINVTITSFILQIPAV